VADSVVGGMAAGQVPTSPAQDLILFDQTAATAKPEDVAAALRGEFDGAGPLLFMSSPVAVEGGETTLASTYAADRASPIEAAPEPVASAYHDFGEPGKLANRQDVIDLDTVFVRFENGVRLTIKPTKFRPGEVDVRVRSPGGARLAGSDAGALSWPLASLVDGSSATIALDDDAVAISGRGQRDDIETVLRTLASPLVDPSWRPGALEHARSKVAAETITDARRRIEPLLSRGPLDVLIVGDVTVEKAIDAVANTFGALPARPANSGAPLIAAAADVGIADDPREAGVEAVLQRLLHDRLAESGIGGRDGAIAALAARTVTEEELVRAKTDLRTAEDAARRTNEHWLDLLAGAQDDSRRLVAIRAHDASIERVTASDVRVAAARLAHMGATPNSSLRAARS
jgi:hypothetical protein